MPDVGRLARLPVHVRPILSVGGQSAANGGEDVGRVALSCLHERLADLTMARWLRLTGLPQVPDPGELRRPAAARLALISEDSPPAKRQAPHQDDRAGGSGPFATRNGGI